jgi:DNA helicase-2/ATP-dependent DNA helicase PcrA
VRTQPEIAAAVAGQRKYALLDEYQDTNYAQRVLLTSIYQHGGVVSAVGDDMQSIYAFRGAHVRNIVEFADHFAPTKLRSLTLNRRSGSNIVSFANRIQGLVAGALDKTLTAPVDAPADGIECFLAASEVEEANQIATDVDGAVRSGHTSWSECAVLCRTRSLIGPITSALERRKIPVEVVGIGGLLERPEIVDLLAWLELLADRTHNVPLVRLLRGPVFRLGDRDLAALARHARGLIDERVVGGERAPMVLADAVRDRLQVEGLSHAAVVRLDELCAVWDDLCAAAERVPLAELCDEIARRTDLWAVCDDTARENLLRFGDLAQRYAPIEGAGGLGEFVDYIATVMESEEELGEATPGDVDAVKVMTVHQAKGLEFDEVWVAGLANKKFPSPSRGGDNPESSAAALPWWVRENSEELPHWSEVSSGQAMTDIVRKRNLDEERRLFYVACTRARRRLVLSAAQWYSGPATPQGPSEFYDFAAAQTDLVAERYRHDPTDRDPRVVAMESYQREAAAAVPPPPVVPAKRGRRRTPNEPVELPMSLFDVSAAPVSTQPRAPFGLSVSSLVSFARCPRQFHWSTVRPLPRRGSTAATVGTIVHRWIETRHGPQGVLLDTDYAESQGIVAGLQQSFADSAYAALVPAAVEAPFELLVGGHIIRGRVDAVYAHGDTDIELVDFKTGRTPADGDPSSQTQLFVYAVAAVDAWGHKPDSLRASFVYLHSDGTTATAVDVALGPELIDAARADLVAAVARIDQGDASTNPGPWCARCDYAAVCPASVPFSQIER